MKLELENESPILNPTEEDIEKEIQKVDGKENGFAILSLDEMTYLQIAGDTSSGFVMEYQNGSLDEHYSTEENVSEKEVIEAFQAFTRGETTWIDQFNWKKEELNKGSGCMSVIVITTVFALSIGLFTLLKG